MSLNKIPLRANLKPRTRDYIFRIHGRPETPLELVLPRLKGVKQSAERKYTALCPAHGDTHNSLSVGVGDDGSVLLYCHTGCSIDDIVAALHLNKSDLFSSTSNSAKPVTKKPTVVNKQAAANGSKVPAPKTPSIIAEPGQDWASEAASYASQFTPRRSTTIANELGVTTASLQALQTGWRPLTANGGHFTFPEHDALGKVIGITIRCRDGSKKMLPGGKRGLYIPPNWDQPEGAIYIVEGASDTAALLSLGLAVIGRPNVIGGVEFLAELLANVPPKRGIVVMGEYDGKPNGSWPGKDGAIKVATKLANKLGRRVRWALPPDGAKDVRVWLKENPNE